MKSVCPKCNQKGDQHIYRDRKNSPRQYLEYIHKTKDGMKRCHIGRIRTTKEVMGEFEKKPPADELYKIINDISKDIKSLMNNYSPNTAVRISVISQKLSSILEKYS